MQHHNQQTGGATDPVPCAGGAGRTANACFKRFAGLVPAGKAVGKALLARLARLARLASIGAAAVAALLVLPGSAHAKADPDKVLRIAMEAADDGFDTMRTNSLYTTWVAMNIFENLLRYDYLARPAKLMPGVAETLPRDYRWGQDLYRAHQKRHLLYARSGVQGPAARIDGRGFCLQPQAGDGPGQSVAILFRL